MGMGMSEQSKKESSQATWGGRFSQGPAELMLRFSESVSFDRALAAFDIGCSRAHSAMLAEVGLISNEDKEEIHAALSRVHEQINKGEFRWDITLEDVHMNIEQALTKETPAAARLHTARSRNDQVATDMRLFLKHASTELHMGLKHFISVLLEVAEKNQKIYIPGYTHLQRAQPVSVAHHLLAYVEMFGRDARRFAQVFDSANWCPLGSGALAGTTLPINREITAKMLSFVDVEGNARMTQNSLDAVADRDVFIEFATACGLVGTHLSRLAEDMILWNSSEFGYVELPEAFTTGSSLMPQKKNPDSLELLRGKSARLQGNVQTLFTLVKGLPLTYNRDLQEDKPPIFDSYAQLGVCLQVAMETVRGIRFREERCATAVSDPLLLATDVADYLVLKGVAFRDAHHIVGQLVAMSEKSGVPLNELPLAEVQAVAPQIGDDWAEIFDLEKALAKREVTGMPGPGQVAAQIERWKRELSDQ